MYTYSLDLNARRVTITYAADAGMTDILEAMNSLATDESFGPGFGVLVDARAMRFVPSAMESRQIASLSADDKSFSQNPTALVVSEMVHFGIGNAVAGLAGKQGLSIQAFYDLEKALEWLRMRQSGALQ